MDCEKLLPPEACEVIAAGGGGGSPPDRYVLLDAVESCEDTDVIRVDRPGGEGGGSGKPLLRLLILTTTV